MMEGIVVGEGMVLDVFGNSVDLVLWLVHPHLGVGC